MKPLGRKAYGSIPHLPGSRRGIADKGLSVQQAAICTTKARKHDFIVVQEKLDGSNVAIAKLNNGDIVALGRSGHLAQKSPYKQHQLFAKWVRYNYGRFDSLLHAGEWISGEWLAQAHGTKYALKHEPFVAFDLFSDGERVPYFQLYERLSDHLVLPELLHSGNSSLSIADAISRLNPYKHGSLETIEGAVWRVEHNNKVEFLAKFVRQDKIDGKYLPGCNGNPKNMPEIWNENAANYISGIPRN